jgi:hypothetical protein
MKQFDWKSRAQKQTYLGPTCQNNFFSHRYTSIRFNKYSQTPNIQNMSAALIKSSSPDIGLQI